MCEADTTAQHYPIPEAPADQPVQYIWAGSTYDLVDPKTQAQSESHDTLYTIAITALVKRTGYEYRLERTPELVRSGNSNGS